MHWKNQKDSELWGDREIEGVKYTFTHLRPFDMRVVKAAKGDLPELNATVRVVFDCHVVTERSAVIERGPEFWLDAGGKSRRFEPRRYQYSLGLPDLLSGLPSGRVKCYIGKHNNFMLWKPADAPAEQAHYQVYFDIYKPAIQPQGTIPLLLLYVQSAYLKDEPFPHQRERFKAFGTICAELLGVIKPKAKGPRSKMRKS
jgi:hypothetical protein